MRGSTVTPAPGIAPPPRSPTASPMVRTRPTRALWAEHQARLSRAVDAIRVAPPAPRMAERDPYALRFGAALLAFAAAVAAGPELYNGFASAFDWRGGDAIAAAAAAGSTHGFDPPPFAGRAPVVIDLKTADPQKLAVFEDSILVVRGEPGVVETRIEGPITPVDQKACGGDRRGAGTSLDDPRRRPGHDPARRREGCRCRLRGHADRVSDRQADGGAARQYQRLVDPRLPPRRPLRSWRARGPTSRFRTIRRSLRPEALRSRLRPRSNCRRPPMASATRAPRSIFPSIRGPAPGW